MMAVVATNGGWEARGFLRFIHPCSRCPPRPTTAPSTRISLPAKGRVRGASPELLDQLVTEFARAARVAVDSGFDAIELHLGHNYLLSSFLSPNLTKRRDNYGG